MSSIEFSASHGAASARGWTPLAEPSPDGKKIRGFFDSIAGRYDFLNHLLSFNLDELWRRRARKILLTGRENSVLDLGMGTGKGIELFSRAKTFDQLVGLDFSINMLLQARKDLPASIRCIRADFHALPFRRKSFDLVTSSFALRSVRDMPRFLREVYEILNDRGTAGFLCLTRPQKRIWRILVYPYLKFYLPLVGGLLSGNAEAYRFLSSSILNFQEPEATAGMMREAGFKDLEVHRFTFGLAALIVGKKS